MSTWAGDGTAGFANGSLATARFNTPGGLTVDGAGAVLVADTHNHRIRKIAGGQVTTVAGDGTAGFADGPLAKARFNQPIRLAVDGSGKIYVADRENHRIRVIVP